MSKIGLAHYNGPAGESAKIDHFKTEYSQNGLPEPSTDECPLCEVIDTELLGALFPTAVQLARWLHERFGHGPECPFSDSHIMALPDGNPIGSNKTKLTDGEYENLNPRTRSNWIRVWID